MKKIIAFLTLLLIITSSFAQVVPVNSRDYKRKTRKEKKAKKRRKADDKTDTKKYEAPKINPILKKKTENKNVSNVITFSGDLLNGKGEVASSFVLKILSQKYVNLYIPEIGAADLVISETKRETKDGVLLIYYKVSKDPKDASAPKSPWTEIVIMDFRDTKPGYIKSILKIETDKKFAIGFSGNPNFNLMGDLIVGTIE